MKLPTVWFKPQVVAAAWAAVALMCLSLLLLSFGYTHRRVSCPIGLEYKPTIQQCVATPTPVPYRLYP